MSKKFEKIPLLDKMVDGGEMPLPFEGATDFKKMHDESFIHVDQPYQPAPIAIAIGTSTYKGNIYYIPFGSYGDYSCIVGSSKSKKTYLKSMFAAGYIGGAANYHFPELKSFDTKGKYIIDLDTEQSKAHAAMAFRRVGDMVGKNSPYYKPFSLRTYSPQQRRDFVDWLVYKSPYKGKIGLLIIDGYADLVNNFNDLDECTLLSQKMLKWSEEGNLHLTGVLHKNFGSEKPVGHLGSVVLKKAETIIFTENNKQTGNVDVTCEYSRNMPFEDFSFRLSEKTWLPYVVGGTNKDGDEPDPDAIGEA